MTQKLKQLNEKQIKNLVLKVAKELNIDVKGIKYFSGHEGMQGINASIYHKGRKFATAYDDARGGEMDIRPIDYELETLDLFKKIERQLKALPAYMQVYDDVDRNGKPYGGKPTYIECSTDLASIVDHIAEYKEELKEAKKGILYIKDGTEYIFRWKISIPQLLKKYPTGAVEAIQKKYNDLVMKGYEITNKDYLTEIGIVTVDLV
jgi:hypothetical protein